MTDETHNKKEVLQQLNLVSKETIAEMDGSTEKMIE